MEHAFSEKIIGSLLGPASLLTDVEQLCAGAVKAKLYGVCIPPLFIKSAKKCIDGSAVKCCTVAGFPFGYSAVEAKLSEIVLSIVDGAGEIGMVINIAALKNNDWQYLAHELNAILPVVRSKNVLLNIIIETSLLNDKEIVQCCDLYGIAGVHAIIPSTAFLSEAVAPQMIALIRAHLADTVKVIAAGNISNRQSAFDLLNAGASLIIAEDALSLIGEKGKD